MIEFVPRHPQATLEHFGGIPDMLSDLNPKSAREQLDAGYSFAGGWQPMQRFTMSKGDVLWYPGDPGNYPIAELRFRDERIVLYDYSMVAIIQPDGSFEVSRMD